MREGGTLGIGRFVPGLAWACALAAAGVVLARPLGGEEGIRAAELRRHVEFLASDALAGRETGEPGVARAEDYVASELRRLGLVPLPGRADLFLDFTLHRSIYDRLRTTLEIDLGGGSTRRAVAGVTFRPFPFSGEGQVEGRVVFAGYGITAPEHGYDDYEGLDVLGAIVLLLRHEPQEQDPESPFGGSASTDHALFTTKAANAEKHGALGMLVVTDPLHHKGSDDLRLGGALDLRAPEEHSPGPAADPGPFIAAQIRRDLAEQIVAVGGRSLEELQRALDLGTRPAGLPALAGVSAQLAVHHAPTSERVPARNVCGFLPGSDPDLRDQWIVIGAHHDHIGGFRGEGDTVYNGADDNASGVAGVLELAEAFARAAQRPRRSLVFLTFTGEERGMLGSRAAIAQQLIPVERVAFMLNLDMIGRNPKRPVDVVGDGFARGLREIIDEANAEENLDLVFGGMSYAGNSDHDSFYEHDVPFVFFFTGTHEDYHQLGDHADKLDYRRMQEIVRVSYRVVERLAREDSRPRFVHDIGWLGLVVEVEEEGGKPALARVTAVEAASRAEKAGFSAGDVIAAFGDRALTDPQEVGQRFREILPGSRGTLWVGRGDERVALAIERARPGYLGVFPTAVDDDLRKAHGLHPGQGIAIRGVAAHGPADQAGVEQGDLLVTLAGKPVGLSDLASRLAQIGAGETVAVQVLRNRERLDLQLTLGERPERP